MNDLELAIHAAKARQMAVTMVYQAASGHLGGSLSCIDILTMLYFDEMHVDPLNPSDPNRDRFVMSKGHCSPALYAILSQRGFFPEAELKQFRQIDGHMSGHVEMHVSGVDMSTGSLGQGFSAAVGMALGAKLKHQAYRVYSILGDGELNEGQIWEALMSASKYHLDNLCIVIDVNGLQIDGRTSKVMPMEPLDQKIKSFGAHVITIDGHDLWAIRTAFSEARTIQGQPTVILAKTIKGKGVSFMEDDPGWHGKAPNAQQYAQAQAELNAHLSALIAKRKKEHSCNP